MMTWASPHGSTTSPGGHDPAIGENPGNQESAEYEEEINA
jgi:hypothetical protein